MLKKISPKLIMHSLLVFIPVAFALEFTHSNPILVFVFSCLSIIPLAGLMGEATEHLSEHFGAGIGGFLNATLGNAAELIIAIMAVKAGLFDVVKASITGSIIGNVLLVMGLSIFVGGLKFKTQKFNPTAAMSSSNMLAFALIPILIPAIMAITIHHELEQKKIETMSLIMAFVLIGIYIASLIFSLKTHKYLFDGTQPSEENKKEAEKEESKHHNVWSIKKSVIILLISTVFVAFISEFLVGAVEVTSEKLGLSQLFIGVIVLAIVGNAAEHFSAVIMAGKNKMDLALNIVFGSSIQIALFVIPVLVFVSFAMGTPMTLNFNFLEIGAIAISVFFALTVSSDGKSNWLEGISLLGVYTIIGVAFYFI